MEIEERRFERKNDSSVYWLVSTTGITFNKSNTPITIPWSEILQVRTVRIIGKEEHTVYTLKSKFIFDRSYNNDQDLVEIIKKSL